MKIPNLKSYEYLNVLQKRFDQFCQLSCLHGLPYLRSDNSLPFTERVFWMAVFILNLILSSYIMHNAFLQFMHTPFMIVYDSDLSFIWDIPFPAVVVCSFVTVKRSVLDLSVTDDVVKLYYSSLVCKNRELFKGKNLTITHKQMDKFYDFLVKVSPTCEELMTSCSWRGVKFPCCEGFKPVVTNSGICYVFNSLPSNLHLADNTMKQFMFNDSYPKSSRYWSPMNGYPQPDLRKDPRYSTLPRWSSQTGEDLGLSIELRQNMDDWQDLCVGGHQGFKVVVQSPAELPIYTHQALKVPMKRDFKIYLSPVTIRTPLDYLHTDHRSRGCLYQGEMKLDNFKMYSITNCVVQCIIDEAITSCGCVGFYAPRNSSVPVCSNNKENLCVRKVVEELVSSRMAIDKDAKQRQGCVCYPVCNELTYDFTSNRNLFFHENESGIYEATDTKQAYSRVSIFYSKLKFLGVRRQAETSFYDFLGNCGGLLSLMTGFSFISGLELVYHLMLRPFCCLMFNKVRNNNLTVVSRPPLRVLAMKHQLRVKDHYFTRS